MPGSMSSIPDIGFRSLPTADPARVEWRKVVPSHNLQASLRAKRPIAGFAHTIRDERVTESLRSVDLDFLLVDMQHTPITIETLQRTLTALAPSDLSALVRAPWNDPATIGQILDVGASGVIVPMVNTASEAARAVAAARYAPLGIRSWGPGRTAYLPSDAATYAREANDRLVVITQVETAEAIDNLDEILGVPGLSAVMIGPADLAISLGYGDDRSNPAVRDAIQSVLDRCLKREVPFGFFAPTLEDGLYWLSRGALIVNCGIDTAFVAGGAANVAASVADARALRSGTHRAIEDGRPASY